MFCHDQWKETLSFNTIDDSKMFDFNLTVEERSKSKTTDFNWHMPCKFENDQEDQKKDMILYYLLYNITLTE